jgi:DNA-binding LacI/PurR family transcriptional regulator
MLDNHGSGAPDVGSLRFEGYCRALTAAGLPILPELSRPIDKLTMKMGRTATLELIDSGIEFDGLFCLTDTVAIGALRGLADRDVSVPDEVKVIGFDAVEEGEYTVPSLSTVDPDHGLMARQAVDLLIDRIDNPDSGRQPVEFVSTYTVIERASTGRTIS